LTYDLSKRCLSTLVRTDCIYQHTELSSKHLEEVTW